MKITNNRFIWAAMLVAGVSFASSNAVAGAIKYDGPIVTFEQMYENPDDNALKLNYARQQAAAGDLLSAAGALEGMLYSQPNWDSARLLYAIVLYELDDRAFALRELDLLDSRSLTSEDKKLVALYRQAMANSELGESALSGVLEFGLRADDNAGNALIDSVIAAADESDTSVIINGAVKVTKPLTRAGGLTFNAGARGQTRKHFKFTDSDYDVIGADIGVSGEGEVLFWNADFTFNNVSIGGEKYLTQMGPKISVGTMISDKTRLTVEGAIYDQDFEILSFSFGEKFRSGNKNVVSAKVMTRVNEDLSYGASIGYEEKIATQSALAYTGFNVAGNVVKAFENGVYVKGYARYRDLSFEAPNLIGGTATERNDSQVVGRVGLGASLNKIGGWLGFEPNPDLKKIYIETGVDYINYNSTVSLFDYENIGTDLKLIWNF